MPHKPATIADVAELAGVAKSSVSNYLNGQVRVADATAARISMAITKLNYRPTAVARSLTTRRRSVLDINRLPPGLPCLTVVGDACIETIAQIGALPSSGEHVSAKQILKVLGGAGANVAALAAGLGGELAVSVSLLTSLGYDLDSDWINSELASRDVIVISSPADPDRRAAQSMVMIASGAERTVISEEVDPGQVDLDGFLSRNEVPVDRRWCLQFDGYHVESALARISDIRAAGFLPAMHTAGLSHERMDEILEAILDEFAVVVVSHASLPPDGEGAFIDQLVETSLERGQWPEAVLVCAGTEGLVAIERGGRSCRVAFPDVAAVDEGGMDDAVAATFLAAWLNGISVSRAISMAARAAAIVAGSVGSQERRPLVCDLETA
ncbi:PfkB family carbohydrate kinase [Oceaniglobus indicus]|uniref:PfkB family carbohydrate kinase n=1 Tax=Oceaniglobus indicus TaxID=2047749 RepID=UPI001F4DEB93|nr:PfkB family carbohydrate kinase [Oceaniglobus indicus]